MKLMRRYIALYKTHRTSTSCPGKLPEYIVGSYCEKRHEANGVMKQSKDVLLRDECDAAGPHR